MSSEHTYCPKCKGRYLEISGTCDMAVEFTPGDPDGQVQSYNAHDWTGMSQTSCDTCGFVGRLKEHFEHDQPAPDPASVELTREKKLEAALLQIANLQPKYVEDKCGLEQARRIAVNAIESNPT